MDGVLGTYTCRGQKIYQDAASGKIGNVDVQLVQTPIGSEATFLSAPTAPTKPDSCTKNPLCFDKFYTCESCCTTGKNSEGHSCWNGQFDPAACCKEASSAATGSVSLFAATIPTRPADSRGNPVPTDSRGYPAAKGSFDSRGRLLPTVSKPAERSTTSAADGFSAVTMALSVVGAVALVAIGVAVRMYSKRRKHDAQITAMAGGPAPAVVPVSKHELATGESSTRRVSSDTTHSVDNTSGGENIMYGGANTRSVPAWSSP